ncbi:arginine--tRNA ligase [Candidatus Pacearchaeota archaeon]|nr:arginine--tRNA ligase [Candidatus Pacearchaeota archaeon]
MCRFGKFYNVHLSLYVMKKLVVDILVKALPEMDIKLEKEEIESMVEVPPQLDMGDYSFPCFAFAEKLKRSPHEIALELREKIGNISELDFESVDVMDGYVNFIFERQSMARKVVWDAINDKADYGSSKIGKGKKIVVEFSSPNVAKPFGIGHLRSTIIGNSLANIADFVGYKVKKVNYLGDWGSQFGKLIAAFEEIGDEDKLMKDSMDYMLKLYVKANKYKKYEKLGHETFQRLENKDRKALMMWKVFRNLSIDEFEKIYNTFKIKFDEFSGESQSVKYTGRVIEELKKKKLLKKSKGAMIVDLKKYDLGVVLIQKTDGTTLYATRDIAEAIRRYEKYKFDEMIYEVGQEQNLYFKQIFKVLELMGYDWAKVCQHVSHGLYLDKDGKKFATRKGKTILMEDILEKTKKLTAKEIKKRWPKVSKKELQRRALIVAIAAIFYGDLKNNRKKDMVFDLKKFTSFEGNTGPYLLYTYARASSILEKANTKKGNSKIKIDSVEEIGDLMPKEFELVKELSLFLDKVQESFNKLNPSVVAAYCYDVCQTFNEFYHCCPVIGSENVGFRLALVEAFRQTLRNALRLLGIDVLEEM